MSVSESPLSQVAAYTRNLTKIYGQGDAKVTALDHVDVGFSKGRFTAVMGPSGSGKSTLMHCVAGLDQPTSGDVFIGDTAISVLRDSKLTALRRDRIGFVFQAFNLVPTLTARENIELPLAIAGRKPDEDWFDRVISAVGLGERLTHKPSQLSGGQQQRVACARALVSRPDIIFADEPTGNLDSRSSAEVLDFLTRFVAEMGQTVVMVTHDPTAAAYANRALFLADGHIVDDLADPTRESVLEHMAHLVPDEESAARRTVEIPAVRTRTTRTLTRAPAVPASSGAGSSGGGKGAAPVRRAPRAPGSTGQSSPRPVAAPRPKTRAPVQGPAAHPAAPVPVRDPSPRPVAKAPIAPVALQGRIAPPPAEAPVPRAPAVRTRAAQSAAGSRPAGPPAVGTGPGALTRSPGATSGPAPGRSSTSGAASRAPAPAPGPAGARPASAVFAPRPAPRPSPPPPAPPAPVTPVGNPSPAPAAIRPIAPAPVPTPHAPAFPASAAGSSHPVIPAPLRITFQPSDPAPPVPPAQAATARADGPGPGTDESKYDEPAPARTASIPVVAGEPDPDGARAARRVLVEDRPARYRPTRRA